LAEPAGEWCACPSATMSTSTYAYYQEEPRTPKRYFNLGVLSCCIGGLVFSAGIILVVLGSSPQEPEALWIAGIVLLLAGGLLFFLGIGSIGLYLAKEDRRKREAARTRTRNYTSSLRSSDVVLVE
ncbi:unnamed protein product, partial [Ixodes pacificus]